MNSRRVYVAALLLVTAVGAFAQPYGDPKFKKKFADADAMAFDGNYEDGLTLFMDLYAHDKSNANVNHGIGLCHLGLRHYQQAVDHLEAATRNVALDYQEANWKEKRAPGKTYYYLAQAYHNLGDFDQAISNYYNYRSFIDMDDYEVYNDVKRKIEYAENAKLLLENPVNVTITNLGKVINTQYPDYCPVISADGNTLIFTSRRETGTGGELTDEGGYFDDIFVCTKQGDTWTKPTSIGSNINTANHEAAIGLSPDGQTLFIYKNEDIYVSELQGNQWSAPKEMGSDINTNSWETHATISADGNLLVFTSNRKDGKGGRDLWYSKKLPNGEWSMAQNMGDSINTPYEEDSPFLTVDGKSLIFSSEGHTSMGGFDLFRSEYIYGKWSSPKNIGYPINSPGNDVFFVTTPDGRYAYYSSVREEGFGETDIYKVRLEIAQPAYATVLSGKMIVPALESDPGITAKIKVTEVATGSWVGEFRPNRATGNYILILDPGIDYNVTYSADGYQPKDVLVDVPENSSYYEIAKTVELDDVVFGEDFLAQQRRKEEEEQRRLEAERQKAIQDSLNAIAADQAALLAAQTAKDEEARQKRLEEERLAREAADEAERKRKEAEAELAASKEQEQAELEKQEQAEQERIRKEREAQENFAAQQLADKQAKEAEEAEKEAQRQAIAKAQAEAAAQADQEERERLAAEKQAREAAEAQRIAAEKADQEAKQTPVAQEEDPVAKKRAELLAKIKALKEKKQGIGYDKPAEPVAQESEPKQQPIVERQPEPEPEPEPVAVAPSENVSDSKNVEAIRARIEALKEDRQTLERAPLAAEVEAQRAKEAAEAAERKAAEAKKAREAELAQKQQEEKNLLAELKKAEEEEKRRAEEARLAAEKARKEREEQERLAREAEAAKALEEQRAREEADRLAKLAEEKRIADEASRKKQRALAEAEAEAQRQNARNNTSNDIEELKRMNRELIAENRKLRDQFAEINRKLDIIINNMGVDGIARNVPEPKETLFSAEELKSGTNFVLKNIFFDYNQATLKPSSKKELNKLYYFLKENGDIAIAVEGHTDSKGDDAYNMRLSQTRAESVKKYLTSMGIAGSRLFPIGYGEKRPIAINQNRDGSDNPEGRALNRRIEISIRKGSSKKMEVEEISIPKGLQIGSR